MRKILITSALFFLFFKGYSQEKNENQNFKRNELKINAVFLVAGIAELTYERLINEESGAGISVFAALDSDIATKFSLTPYYRFYFGKKPAAGFYIEGFGMLNNYQENYSITYFNSNTSVYTFEDVKGKSVTDFALGFGIGSKWITKKGIIFELNAGIGRNLFNEISKINDNQIVGRGGLIVGYRF